MEITEIKVFPLEEEKLRAFVSIVFDNCFMVNDIKIIRGRDGLFISMPSRRKRNGKFKDVAHPLNNETRQVIEEQILEAYERTVDGGEESEPPRRARTFGSAADRGEEAVPPANSSGESSPSEEPAVEGNTLEEIAELHLRDSFWTT